MLDSILGILNFITLFATGLIVFFYTRATFSLLKTAKETNELTMLPLLTLRYGNDVKHPKMIVKNIGKGAALNVKITDIVMKHCHPQGEVRSHFINLLCCRVETS